MARTRTLVLTAVGTFVLSLLLSAMLMGQQGRDEQDRAPTQADKAAGESSNELAKLKAEVASLKTALSTSMAMHEVDHHAQNLWFAGAAGNWPLASYYWDKLLLHMRPKLEAGSNERPDQFG